MTATFFAAAAFAAHLRNESRNAPTLGGDAVTGVLAALAMLSKFTDLIAVLAIGALSAWLWLREGPSRDSSLRLLRRAAVLGLPILLIAGPWYARNLAEFGTPFMTSADVPDVHRIQASQPPGERHAVDFLRFPLAVVDESVPSAPHMVHAVWPNTYLNVWFDTFRESQLPFPRDLVPHPFIHQLTLLFGLLGLLPTGIALLGAVASARRSLRDPSAAIDAGMCILALGTLAAFLLFSIRVPTWAALKASYLLNLSLPFAWFLARGSLALARRDAWLGAVTPVVVGLIAASVSYVFATGRPPGLMRRDFDSMQMHQLRAFFGDYRATRQVFRADAPKRSYLESRAAVELLDGNPRLARRFYEHAGRLPPDDPNGHPWWLNRLAVACALDDHPERARMLLDEGLAEGRFEELLVNRAALAAREGDWDAAERDLREALERAPALPPAWANLAIVLGHRGQPDEAREARARFEELRELPPRGFPYGVGNGFLYESGAGQRFMLLLDEEGGLSLYQPPRARNRSHARAGPPHASGAALDSKP
jgi:tetratricopeptide (TPR) repeat protein